MVKFKHLIAALGLVSLATPVLANNIIDFEGYSKGRIIDSEYYNSLGVTIRGVNVDRGGEVLNPGDNYDSRAANNVGVIFDSNANNSQDPDLEAPFYNVDGQNLGVANPGNILILHERPWECGAYNCGNDPDDEGSRPAGYFNIEFDEAVSLNSIDFFDIESGENGNSYKNEIVVAGNNGNSLFYTPNTGGNNTWTRLNFNVVGVTSIRIKLHGSGAIDNINFSNINVPAPASVVVLAIGLLGGLMRRRTAVQA